MAWNNIKKIEDWIGDINESDNYRTNLYFLIDAINKLEKYENLELKEINNKTDKNTSEFWQYFGVVFQEEYNELKKNFFSSTSNPTKVRITVDSKILKELKKPDNLEFKEKPNLKEATSEDWKNAFEICANKKEICGTKSQQDTKCILIKDNNICPIKCVGRLAYAIANKKDDDMLHPYIFNTTTYRNKFPKELESEYKIECEEIKNKLEKKVQISNEMVNKKMKKQPLNQILYGSPGTGKTYHTINKAIEIIENRVLNDEELKSENRKALKDEFEKYRKSGQIEFVTFHQSYGYEEFVEGIKADLKSDDIKYKLEKGIFKKLSNLAELNYRKSTATISTKKDFDTLFKEQILDKLIDDEKLKISTPKKHFFITEVNEKTIFFEKAEGQIDHSLSIKTLKEMYENGKNEKIKGGLSVYYEPILNLLLENSLFDEVDEEPLKNYILIIDEINRGNISKIFGELITLIEPSKRIGADEEIRVKLPYSGDDFGVPSNLYIIGTMNTADRSIALMDTALRRRFHFEEMMPNPELLKDIKVGEIDIKSLLETINKRIEYLYDRDHTIGHAYFMSLKGIEKEEDKKAELDNIFRNKIIPLLQEYFYDDWEKIQMVLGDHPEQFKKKSNLKEYLEYQFIQSKVITEDDILGFDHPDIENEALEYKVNNIFVEKMYIKIYSNYPQIKQNIE